MATKCVDTGAFDYLTNINIGTYYLLSRISYINQLFKQTRSIQELWSKYLYSKIVFTYRLKNCLAGVAITAKLRVSTSVIKLW